MRNENNMLHTVGLPWYGCYLTIGIMLNFSTSVSVCCLCIDALINRLMLSTSHLFILLGTNCSLNSKPFEKICLYSAHNACHSCLPSVLSRASYILAVHAVTPNLHLLNWFMAAGQRNRLGTHGW